MTDCCRFSGINSYSLCKTHLSCELYLKSSCHIPRLLYGIIILGLFLEVHSLQMLPQIFQCFMHSVFKLLSGIGIAVISAATGRIKQLIHRLLGNITVLQILLRQTIHGSP